MEESCWQDFCGHYLGKSKEMKMSFWFLLKTRINVLRKEIRPKDNESYSLKNRYM